MSKRIIASGVNKQGEPSDDEGRSRGRPPRTTAAEISRAALGLFAAHGFEETTMDDIAADLGIARRTLFRYFPSKNDLVWGDFERVLGRLRSDLDATERDLPVMAAVRRAAVSSNSYPQDALPELRIRMRLITMVPALQAHSMLRYAEWRDVVAAFAARRLRRDPDDLVPLAIGHAALAASMSAFGHWVDHPEKDLLRLLDRSYGMLEAGFEAGAVRRLARGI